MDEKLLADINTSSWSMDNNAGAKSKQTASEMWSWSSKETGTLRGSRTCECSKALYIRWTFALCVVALGLKSKPAKLALYAHCNSFWSISQDNVLSPIASATPQHTYARHDTATTIIHLCFAPWCGPLLHACQGGRRYHKTHLPLNHHHCCPWQQHQHTHQPQKHCLLLQIQTLRMGNRWKNNGVRQSIQPHALYTIWCTPVQQ